MAVYSLVIEEKKKGEFYGEYLYRVLKKNIIYFHLAPGEAVSENILASKFQISRTPMREAINKLVADELLEVYPQRGSYVSFIDMNRVREALLMRELLEKEAVTKACQIFGEQEVKRLESNLNQQIIYYGKGQLEELMALENDFHNIIFNACNLNRVWHAIQGISSDLDRIRFLKLRHRHRWEETLEEYKLIFDNLKSKNLEKAIGDIQSQMKKMYQDARMIRKLHPEYFNMEAH